MRIVWEADHWWWEDLGVFVGPDGRKWWYFGSVLRARPAPEWLQWLPTFRLRYPDKVGHACLHFLLTWGLARADPWLSYLGPPTFGLWYEFRGGLASGHASWRDLIANTVGWALALLAARGA